MDDRVLTPLSRTELAVLGREHMLACHLQDRVGIPLVLSHLGFDAMREVAIDEWMGASPIYTRRMQRALRFEGDDVATIFKGMQLDVGAPHEFLDFRFVVRDAHHGEFTLASCGALLDVEPMGEPFVRMMCHDIEDPTFDATAAATNPRARVRPYHRPPRVPADREPHCHWQVYVDLDAEPIPEPAVAEPVARSRLARVALSEVPEAADDGRPDYSGPFDPHFRLGSLSHGALVRAVQELCLQGHLLVRSFMLAVAARGGDDLAREIASQQWIGIGGLAAERVHAATGDGSTGTAAIARMLRLHPAFHPRAYVDVRVTHDDDAVHVAIGDCEALAEGDPYSWFALLGPEPPPALAAMARAVDPRARVEATSPSGDERLAWRVVVDPGAEPVPEPDEVALTKVSTGAAFRFSRPA